MATPTDELLEDALLHEYRELPVPERRRIAQAASPDIRLRLAWVERQMAMDRSPGALASVLTEGREKQAPHLDMIDDVFRRIAAGERMQVMITCPPRHGKALALETPIPTPKGWTTMGELKAGDEVFDELGKPCTVTWTSPTWYDRPCFDVVTDSGGHIVADYAHEWKASLDRRYPDRLYNTCDLARTRAKQAMIWTANALELPDQELPVPPYLLGAWLGDGRSDDGGITADPEDAKHLRTVIHELGYKTVQWSRPTVFGVVGLRSQLRSLGVLGNKHVPAQYLRGSIEQRRALLQGLVDTDGHVAKDGQVEFCSIKRGLAEAVQELVYSLGGKASLITGDATLNGRFISKKYRVMFYMEGAARLPRKAAKCRTGIRSNRHYVMAMRRSATATRCIEVDSPSHLFLAGRAMIPTHNSQRASRWGPLWYLRRNPTARVMLASYGAELADDHGRWVRDQLRLHGNTLGVRLDPASRAANRFDLETPRGSSVRGGMVTAGVGGSLTGKGFSLGVIDDPFKGSDDANSPAQRQRVWDWYRSVFYTRRAPGASIVLINCIVGSMRALGGDGRWKPISEIRPGDTVVSLADDQKTLVTAKVMGQRLSGEDATLNVATDRLSLRVNGRHPFAVLRSDKVRPDPLKDLHWVRAEDLEVGDLVITTKSLPDDYVASDVLPDGSPVDEERAWLLGYLLGDGWAGENRRANGRINYYVACAKGSSQKEWKQDLDDRLFAALDGWSPNKVYETKFGYWRTEWADGGRLLRQMGYGSGARGKRVPDCVWGWSPSLRRAFLFGYAEADGGLQYKGKKRDTAPVWRIGSVNKELLDDVRDLALTCGVRPTTVFVDRPRWQQPPGSPKPVLSTLCSIGLSFGPSHAEGRGSIRIGSPHPAPEHLRYERIRSITPGPALPVYDLAVEGTENFVAEGFVVHNTRWHEKDLSGQILDTEPENWTLIDLPALALSDTDPLGRQPGEALWPEQYDEEELARTKRAVGERVWWALYQQQPRPLEGGVWQWAWITDNRINPVAFRAVDLTRVVVALDPAGGDTPGHDESGIVAAGRSADGHYYVLADRTGSHSAEARGREACLLALELQADAIAVETNYGGDMARQNVIQAWNELERNGRTKGQPMPRVVDVTAKKGKRLRAEPIAQLYETNLVHHLAEFPSLETQMVTWVPGMDSPDRLDALVHALTELANPAAASVGTSTYSDHRLTGRR
ncbi:LAGLIDADG family homing endonuclease [Streptomyces sp. rh34]|uniref:LAGLIDADG family homing endonuclease n=1 Tax=Streptomyces sp. rh34 TaxID=2034272 RepID=UPI000BEFF0D7|nr:LAGLIDADG family homing endonuclease [Streptomyces sp. rh34]